MYLNNSNFNNPDVAWYTLCDILPMKKKKNYSKFYVSLLLTRRNNIKKGKKYLEKFNNVLTEICYCRSIINTDLVQ